MIAKTKAHRKETKKKDDYRLYKKNGFIFFKKDLYDLIRRHSKNQTISNQTISKYISNNNNNR
jgi:isochorismate hydrolase